MTITALLNKQLLTLVNIYMYMYMYVRLNTGEETNLGRDEVGRITGRHQHAVISLELLGETKITDTQFVGAARLVLIEDVRRLQVAVHHLPSERTSAK